jgi:SNF2 family DNA or RNA helicase|nr:MAG TPA: Chromatin remodeling complex ATPase [Caudoviricetes sp.]
MDFVFKTRPFKHQLEAYDFTRGKDYFALFMQQGTGKTKTAIDICGMRYNDGGINAVLVIAPNHVHSQWGNEQIPIHCSVPHKVFVFHSGMGKQKTAEFKSFISAPGNELKWLCVNVESFSYSTYLHYFQDYCRLNNVFIILDEATSIKNPQSKRFINIVRGLSDCKMHGRRLVSSIPLSKGRAILTGTPITNSPLDAWAMFEFLKQDYFGRPYYSFKAHYTIEQKMQIWQGNVCRTITTTAKDIQDVAKKCGTPEGIVEIQTQLGISPADIMYIQAHPDLQMPYKYLDELKEKMQECAFFKKSSECFDLPPKIYEHVSVELNDEQKRMYQQLEEEYISEYDGKVIPVLNKITLYTRLSQLAGGFLPFIDDDTNAVEVVPIGQSNPKVDALVGRIENGDLPCIVVTRFTAEAEYLYTRLCDTFKDRKVGLFIGPKKVPKDPVEEFKKGHIDILIANERMISKGHNLQLSHTLYFFSCSYSLEDRDQTEDRIARYGQTEKCLIVDFIATGTIDMKVYAALRQKRNLLDFFRNTTIKEDLTESDQSMHDLFNV